MFCPVILGLIRLLCTLKQGSAVLKVYFSRDALASISIMSGAFFLTHSILLTFPIRVRMHFRNNSWSSPLGRRFFFASPYLSLVGCHKNKHPHRSTVAHSYVICFSPGGPGFKSWQETNILSDKKDDIL